MGQNDAFTSALSACGATVEWIPFTKIRTLDVAWPLLDNFDLVILSSQNAASRFAKAYDEVSLPQVACIGEKTADVVRAQCSASKLIVSGDSHGEGLANLIKAEVPGLRGLRVFSPQAVEARGKHLEMLESAGAKIRRLQVYSIEKCKQPQRPSDDIDYVTFFSGRSLESFVEQVEEARHYLLGRKLVVIGPITAARAVELGLRVDIVAAHAHFESMIDSMESDARVER